MSQVIPRRFHTVLFDREMFCSRILCEMQINCVITFDGRIDEERMARVVRLTLDAEPLLGCRFVKHWWQPYWERRSDLDSIDLCELTETGDVEQDLIRFLTIPMDPCVDPLVQVRIIRSDTDTLCIKMDHMVADAAGVKDYLYMLASIYQRLVREPGYMVQLNLGSRSFSQVSRHLSFSDKLKILKSGFNDIKNRSLRPHCWTFPAINDDLSDRSFAIHRIDQNKFGAIKEYGRKHRATINDVLVAAFYRALAEHIPPDSDTPLRLLLMADLRRYLPEGGSERICNLSTRIFPNIDHELGATFDDTCSMVRDYMNARKANYIGLGDIPFMAMTFKGYPFFLAQWPYNLLLRYISKSTGGPPMLTNAGIIDSERLYFGGPAVTDAFLTVPLTFPPFLAVGVTTHNGSLTLSAGFCKSALDKQTVQHIFHLFENELPGGESI